MVIAVLTSLAACALMAMATATSSSVLSLSEQDLNLALKGDNTLMFIKFYAPWCGFCKKIAPVWSELAASQPEVTMAKVRCSIFSVCPSTSDTPSPLQVDCTVHKALCSSYGVNSYPSFKFIQHHALHDYLGARSKEVLTVLVELRNIHGVTN